MKSSWPQYVQQSRLHHYLDQLIAEDAAEFLAQLFHYCKLFRFTIFIAAIAGYTYTPSGAYTYSQLKSANFRLCFWPKHVRWRENIACSSPIFFYTIALDQNTCQRVQERQHMETNDWINEYFLHKV